MQFGNTNGISAVVLQYTVVFNVKTFKCQLGKLKLQIAKVSSPRIEPTVSYKLFLIREELNALYISQRSKACNGFVEPSSYYGYIAEEK